MEILPGEDVGRLFVIAFVLFVILIVFVTAFRKGWLPNIKSKWLHIQWIDTNPSKEIETPHKGSVDSEESISDHLPPLEQAIPHVRSYKISFTQKCRDDIEKLNLSQDNVLDFIQDEFRSHLNYFRFDLEDYAIPVKARFIVYLDKVQNSLTLKGIVPCTTNQAKLSSWNDILALYRQGTRLAYRKEPEKIFLEKRILNRAVVISQEIGERVIKHFDIFESIDVSPLRPVRSDERTEYSGVNENGTSISEEIAFHIAEAALAEEEAVRTMSDFQTGIVQQDEAKESIVTALERSLQHLHKILVRFPPTA